MPAFAAEAQRNRVARPRVVGPIARTPPPASIATKRTAGYKQYGQWRRQFRPLGAIGRLTYIYPDTYFRRPPDGLPPAASNSNATTGAAKTDDACLGFTFRSEKVTVHRGLHHLGSTQRGKSAEGANVYGA